MRAVITRLMRALVVFFVITAHTACTVHYTVTIHSKNDASEDWSPDRRLPPNGRRITVALKDGTRVTGKLVDVTSSELVTQQQRIPFSQIKTVKYEKVDQSSSFWATVATVSLIAVAVFAYALEHSEPKPH